MAPVDVASTWDAPNPSMPEHATELSDLGFATAMGAVIYRLSNEDERCVLFLGHQSTSMIVISVQSATILYSTLSISGVGAVGLNFLVISPVIGLNLT